MNKIEVSKEDILYKYLRESITNKSKNNIKTLLKNECIMVNDKIITKYDYKLHIGDIIYINKKEDNLKIIYEDDDIIVIDKPSKILTISNRKEKENTLYHMVSDYLKKEKKKVFIIHRLDYDTSGVIIFAKSEKIQKMYQDNWNNLAKKREYIAVVEGKTDDHGHIESYLKQTKTLKVYSSKKNDGLFAITDYERIKTNNKYSLLRILISTGRRNQIRCHMSDINHPILGDSRYQSKLNPIKRLCLHASTLVLENPKTKKIMTFTSPYPKSFDELLN